MIDGSGRNISIVSVLVIGAGVLIWLQQVEGQGLPFPATAIPPFSPGTPTASAGPPPCTAKSSTRPATIQFQLSSTIPDQKNSPVLEVLQQTAGFDGRGSLTLRGRCLYNSAGEEVARIVDYGDGNYRWYAFAKFRDGALYDALSGVLVGRLMIRLSRLTIVSSAPTEDAAVTEIFRRDAVVEVLDVDDNWAEIAMPDRRRVWTPLPATLELQIKRQ